MAKFYGRVGYGSPQETRPGVWEDVIVERQYYGDVLRSSRNLVQGDSLNKDLTVSNQISIVADSELYDHFFAIRYVEWAGTLWTVTAVEDQRPRLIFNLGEVYNGPTP